MMKSLFSRRRKQKEKKPQAVNADVEDDWQLVDEEGECTNYTPDASLMPYAGLFTPGDRLVKRSDFAAIKTLGKGASGVVLLVRYKVDGNLYAMKIISKSKILQSGRPADAVRERDIMKTSAACKFLVKMHYCFQSTTKLFFILDYMPGGDLYYYTGEWEGGHFDESTARYYAASVYKGLQWLHDHKVIYRDLKPENVLLDGDGHPKLADFGFSKELSPEGEDGSERASSFVGTAFYIAPEILRKEKYSYGVDWWSYGVLLFNMLTGENPFYGDDCRHIFKSILHKDYSVRDEYNVSAAAKDLMKGLLEKDESKRLSGQEIKDHPWFAGFDWDSLGEGVAPTWRKAETADPDMLVGKTMKEDSFSVKDNRLAEANQEVFQGFTLDNTKDILSAKSPEQ